MRTGLLLQVCYNLNLPSVQCNWVFQRKQIFARVLGPVYTSEY